MALTVRSCPVCREAKEKAWHLTCPSCWAKVPVPQRREVYHLFKHRRGSDEHVSLCREVIRQLIDEREEARLSAVDAPSRSTNPIEL